METVNVSEEASKLNLTDLIDLETLRLIQNSFSNMAGIACLITNKDGIAITEGLILQIFVLNLCVPRRRAGSVVRTVIVSVRRTLGRKVLFVRTTAMQD